MSRSSSRHCTTEELAAYLSGRLNPADRAAVEAHAVGCAECRRHLAGATRLLRQRSRARRMGAASLIGLTVLIAGLLVRAKPSGELTPDSLRSGTPNIRIERRTVLSMITPVKEGYLSSDSARFVWHSAGSGMHYRLTVANQVGDLVWEAETADTVLQMPVEFELIVGARYVWYVDAMGEDGESVTSGPLSFTAR